MWCKAVAIIIRQNKPTSQTTLLLYTASSGGSMRSSVDANAIKKRSVSISGEKKHKPL